jgi:cytochrome P450
VSDLDREASELDQVVVSSLDLDDPAVRANPYPLYDRLREHSPILPSELEERAWILTRFADCEAVLRDPRWSSNPTHRPLPPPDQADVRQNMAAMDAHVLLFIDPPDHTRLRKLMSKAFTPRTVEKLRPRVQQIVDEILDGAQERGELDVVSELGYVVPVTVICEMIGVPVEDRDLFGPWSSDASRLLDGVLDEETTMRGLGGAMQIINYLNGLIEQHRAHPQNDLLSALIAAEEEGDRLTEDELRTNLLLLFVAGHETTMNLIGNGTYALLQHPDQLERLRQEPDLISSAVEELLRWDGPVHVTGRVASEDGLVIGGQEFAKGDQVITHIAAANRDPERFAGADRLDVGRNDSHHLAFSLGIHYCLGAALARLEGQVAIGSLVQRFPTMTLVTDPVEYRDHFVLRGLKELRVRV